MSSETPTSKEASNADVHSADAVDILTGREHIRRRPGMYIGDCGVRGLHHLVYELVDNALNEAAAGHCDRIDIELLACGGCRVGDDGRGLPTKIQQDGRPFFEAAFTQPGCRRPMDEAPYRVARGFGCVGLCVVNALSTDLIVEVRRDRRLWRQRFRRGNPDGAAYSVLIAGVQTGTRIAFWPDRAIFTEVQRFDYESLADRFRELAALHKGVAIHLSDYRDCRRRSEEFHFPDGIVALVLRMNQGCEAVHTNVVYLHGEDENCAFEVAFQWAASPLSSTLSFVNSAQTQRGGTHVEGFHRAVSRTLTACARMMKILPDSGSGLHVEDWRPGLTAVVSVNVREPSFGGSSKSLLVSPEIQTSVHRGINRLFAKFLYEHPRIAKAVLSHIHPK